MNRREATGSAGNRGVLVRINEGVIEHRGEGAHTWRRPGTFALFGISISVVALHISPVDTEVPEEFHPHPTVGRWEEGLRDGRRQRS